MEAQTATVMEKELAREWELGLEVLLVRTWAVELGAVWAPQKAKLWGAQWEVLKEFELGEVTEEWSATVLAKE
jgi:hypothetical protein